MKRSAHLGKRLLAFALVLCTITIVAFAAGYSKKILTNLVVDGKIYSNATNFEWDMEYVVPDGGIEWDGTDDFLAVVDFTQDELEPCPDSDVHSEYYVRNQIVFMGIEGKNFENIQQMAAKYGAIIVAYLAPTEDYIIEFVDEKGYLEMQEVINQIRQEKWVLPETVQLRYVFEIEPQGYPSDPWGGATWDEDNPAGKNWNIEEINAPSAWDHIPRMSQTNIGIIDTMFFENHPDLNFVSVFDRANQTTAQANYERGLILGRYIPIWNEEYEKTLPQILHGTHVAGTFAAIHNDIGVSGVYPKSAIVATGTLFQNEEEISNEEIQDAVERIYNVHDPFLDKFYFLRMRGHNAKVINLSMGFSYSEEEYDRLRTDEQYGIRKANDQTRYYSLECGYAEFFRRLEEDGYEFVLVLAAGNDECDARNAYWPVYVDNEYFRDRLIVVGAYGRNARTMASFSNFGEVVDVVAPGVRIYSTLVNPQTGDYVYDNETVFHTALGYIELSKKQWDGTSMAAPHVAGTAAMIWSVNPEFTGKQVKEIILSTANYNDSLTALPSTDVNRFPDIDSNGNLRAYPRLDAGAAVSAAVSIVDSATPTSTPTPTPEPEATPTVTPVSTSEVTGIVIDSLNSPLNEVTVSVLNKGLTAVTDENGGYLFELPVGTYTLVFEKTGYQTAEKVITIEPDDVDWTYIVDAVTMIENMPVIESGKGIISGVVQENGQGIKYAAVLLIQNDTVIQVVQTDDLGNYAAELDIGEYAISVQKTGYYTYDDHIVIPDRKHVVKDIELKGKAENDDIYATVRQYYGPNNQLWYDVTLFNVKEPCKSPTASVTFSDGYQLIWKQNANDEYGFTCTFGKNPTVRPQYRIGIVINEHSGRSYSGEYVFQPVKWDQAEHTMDVIYYYPDAYRSWQ